MRLSDYQEQAGRTLPHPTKDDQRELKIAAMALGLAGEAGEVADLLKKVLWHEHDYDAMKLAKELGDVLWYLAAVATLHGIRLDDVATLNLNKLAKRYPEGFTRAASIDRKEGDR